jgi:hypothetical protein
MKIKNNLKIIIGMLVCNVIPIKGMLQQTPTKTKLCYDLMMILDPNKEHEDSSGSYCSLLLTQALRESAFPIIVSSNIVENICSWKQDSTKSPLSPEVLYMLYPTNDNWYCYSHKTAPLMLLIPKKYVGNFMQTLSVDITEQMKQCGFSVENLHYFENLLPATILSYVKQQKLTLGLSNEFYKILTEDVASIFIDGINPKVSTMLTDNPTWNIYLSGHATYFQHNIEEKLIAGLVEDEFFKLMNVFQKIKTSFLQYVTCFAGGQNLIKVKEALFALKTNFMVSTLGTNEAATRGFLIENRLSFVSLTPYSNFFKKLNIFFGNPKSFAQRIKREVWENNPIASIVNEIVDKNVLDETQPWIYIPVIGVFNALSVDKSLKILTKSLTRAYEFEGTTIDFTHPDIETIIIYPDYIGVPLNIKPHVAIVSPTGLKETKNSIIHVFEKIIYKDKLSSIIPNFISFNYSVSPITFVIKKLECFDYNNSGLGAGSNNPIVIENMVISIVGKEVLVQETGGYRKLDAIITILFTHNNNTYSFSQEIKNLAGNSRLLFDQFKNLPASKLTSEELSTLVINSNVLKNCGISDTSGMNMTLENIVKAIESTIDKTTVVQEPGALKRSLLLKQKNILEKEAHEFTLPSMNKQIKKSNKELVLKQPKSLISAVKYWQQRIEKAKKLESEIEKTPFTKQITIKQSDKQEKIQPIKVDEQQIYRQDMVNLQEELQKKYDSALAEQPWQEYLTTNFNKYFNVIKTYPQKFLDKVNDVKNNLFSTWKKIMYQNYQKQR